MGTEIFIPIFYMVILTSAIFLFNVIIRFKDVLIGVPHFIMVLFQKKKWIKLKLAIQSFLITVKKQQPVLYTQLILEERLKFPRRNV